MMGTMTTTPANIREQSENNILCANSGRIYVKSINGPVISIGTFPMHDYAGDYVEPGRGDWSAYTIPFGQPGSVFGPVANWTHGCPIGRGKVEVKTLTYEGRSSPVEVMTTEFFQTAADVVDIDLRRRNPQTNRSWDKQPPYTIDDVLRVAAQAEVLVRDEVATGVSVEFDVNVDRKGTAPYEGDYWDLPQDSLLDGRKARHFYNWRGLGYAHARKPVNPGCMTLQSDPAPVSAVEQIQALGTNVPSSIEKAIRVAQTGKLPNGEVACEIILKAFTDLKDYRSRGMILTTDTPPTTTTTDTQSTTPPVSNGAAQQAPPANTPATNPNPASAVPSTPSVQSTNTTPPATTPITPSTPTTPVVTKGYYDYSYSAPSILTETPSRGCRAFYNTAQCLLDIASCLETDAGESDDLSVRKFAKKEAERLREEAAVFKARAEKLRSKLEGKDEDDWDDEDMELSTEEKAITCADDGALVIKSYPDWKPRRMTIANLSPAEPAPQATSPEQPALSPEEQVVLDAQYKVLVKALRHKARIAKELMEAAIANGRI